MLIVGITGGIGSGKTTICKIFEILNVPVYYSDTEAKKLLDENVEVKTKVINEFGTEIIDEENKIDRAKLASKVFNNKEKLNILNSIVHPAVALHFENWCKKHTSFHYVLKEAAILFESGAYLQTNKIISVTAPASLKIQRTIKRDNVSEDMVMQRMKNQINDEERINRSDFVINNDEKALVIPQVLNIHWQIMKMS